MKVSRLIAIASAFSLASSPALAQVERASQPSGETSEIEGSGSVVLLILAAAAIIAGLVIALGGSDDEAVSA